MQLRHKYAFMTAIVTVFKVLNTCAYKSSFVLRTKCPAAQPLSHKIRASTAFSTMVQDSNKQGKLDFTVGLEPFCYKQFDTKGANHIPCQKQDFLNQLRELIASGDVKFTDGYAPFCKHLFVKNFTDAICGTIEITGENEHLLRSGYAKRAVYELPVLERWFPLEKVQHLTSKAQYLDVILYSREQIQMEYKAIGHNPGDDVKYDCDYYVVSIRPQQHQSEYPMQPITMMRNTLIAEGGSGVALDRQKYLEAVDFWSRHALVQHK